MGWEKCKTILFGSPNYITSQAEEILINFEISIFAASFLYTFLKIYY